MPDVSIIVATRSVRTELERCFESIDRHSGVETETILVDNASTDDTREWVRSEHPEVRLVELPDNRFGAGQGATKKPSAGGFTPPALVELRISC